MNPYILSKDLWHVIGQLFVAFMLIFSAWALLHGLAEAWREWNAYGEVKKQFKEENRANKRF